MYMYMYVYVHCMYILVKCALDVCTCKSVFVYILYDMYMNMYILNLCT